MSRSVHICLQYIQELLQQTGSITTSRGFARAYISLQACRTCHTRPEQCTYLWLEHTDADMSVHDKCGNTNTGFRAELHVISNKEFYKF